MSKKEYIQMLVDTDRLVFFKRVAEFEFERFTL